MKKRALTIFTTLVSAASIVTAVAVTKSDDSIFKISGQDEPTMFSLDYSSVESIDDDTYQVTLRNKTGGPSELTLKVPNIKMVVSIQRDMKKISIFIILILSVK